MNLLVSRVCIALMREPSERYLFCLEDDSHPAAANLTHNAVVAEHMAGRCRVLGRRKRNGPWGRRGGEVQEHPERWQESLDLTGDLRVATRELTQSGALAGHELRLHVSSSTSRMSSSRDGECDVQSPLLMTHHAFRWPGAGAAP